MRCCNKGNKKISRKHKFGQKICESEIALVGNPNTGKSCLFSYLTGMGAIVSNYPGTTVDILEGKSNLNGRMINIVDLPGTYSLGDSTDDERVTKDYIIEKKPRAIINVLDATLLERNLYLTLQLLELKTPMVIALNFYEELEDKGMHIDFKELSNVVGVPVVPIDALRGAGIKKLIEKTLKVVDNKERLEYYKIEYGEHIEKAAKEITGFVKRDDIPKRASAIKIIEGDKDICKEIENKKEVDDVLKKYSEGHDLKTDISRQRHGQAAIIAKSTTKKKKSRKHFRYVLDRFTTEPLTGTISLIAIMAILFSSLFYLGGYLSELFGNIFRILVTEPLTPFISSIGNSLIQTIVKWSLDGIDAGIQIALPYIAVFYIMLAILEDTGYLPRMAYLLDRIMHKLHLHGKAIVPMMLGFGCSVPAILATRILPNKKERILTSILVSLVPCSARTAVIFGAVGKFIGFKYALLIYAIILALILITGYVLGRLLPGEAEGLILEMPDYRYPKIKNVIQKTWLRVKDFIYIALPILILGSVILGILKDFGLLATITKPFEPIISGWLMLPAAAGITLVYGVLRKELALELLFVLGGSAMLLDFMNPLQIFVFALVVALYIPCVGTFAVLKNEFGWKNSILISLFTIILAVVVGGLVGRLFMFFEILA